MFIRGDGGEFKGWNVLDESNSTGDHKRIHSESPTSRILVAFDTMGNTKRMIESLTRKIHSG